MEKTWESEWSRFEEFSGFTRREGQQIVGSAIFENVFNGGQLCAEAPTGVGKSVALLIPAIAAFQQKKHRTILTTETISLLDQIVDKDLPFLQKALGHFSYFGLKGRNHYLCKAKAGRNNPIIIELGSKIDGTLGERRDVERALRRRLDDDDWSDICGDTEFCAHNRCAPEVCYSTAAKVKALNSDIVITSHTMLQIHGEFIQSGNEPLLGEFAHVMIDEGHSLERVVISGSTMEVSPWELYAKLSSVRKGMEVVSNANVAAMVEELEKRIKDSLHIIQNFMEYQTGKHLTVDEWARQCMPLALTYISNASQEHEAAMIGYEEMLPDMLEDIVEIAGKIANFFKKEMETLEKGKGKVSKAISAVMSLASVFGLVNSTIRVTTGTVEAYGTNYALFADGIRSRDINGVYQKNIIIRAVPLDVSNFLRQNVWKDAMSVTVVSATLRDMAENSFRFVKRSLGLDRDAKECLVDSPFDFKKQQLIYLTEGFNDDVPVYLNGARFSESELTDLVKASKGRTLILFTSIKEMDYVAELLKKDKGIPWKILVQDKYADKSELAREFKEDTHSILLGSNSFVQGFDVPGEALSQVILVKWFNPRYDPVMKAQIRHWRDNGFPNYYTTRSLETTVQALGRGVRSDDCKVVCSILDNRVAEDKNSVRKNAWRVIETLYPQSTVTSNVSDVGSWLS